MSIPIIYLELWKLPQNEFGDALCPLWDGLELKPHWSSDLRKPLGWLVGHSDMLSFLELVTSQD